MRSSITFVRLVLACAYGIIVFAFLSYWYSGNTFCDGRYDGTLLHVLKLTIAIGALDFVSGLCALMIGKIVNSEAFISPFLAAMIVGIAMFSFPDFIYEGYGHFRFENTPLNVKCLFEEGAEIAFIAVVAPLVTGLTFVRELTVSRIKRRQNVRQLAS